MSLDDLTMFSEHCKYVDQSDCRDASNARVLAAAVAQLHDSKYEKKVTFARRLNKLSADINSDSEVNVLKH